MTAFTVRWDSAVALRPVLKHPHTQTRPPDQDSATKHTLDSLSVTPNAKASQGKQLSML